jgi:hypothetical protein
VFVIRFSFSFLSPKYLAGAVGEIAQQKTLSREEVFTNGPHQLVGTVTRISQGGAPDGADPNEA